MTPNFTEAFVGRALALLALGRPDDALAALDRALEINPKLAPAHKARGSVLQAMGRENEAGVSLAKAAEIEAESKAAKDEAGEGKENKPSP